MPQPRFSWNAFPDDVLDALAVSCGHRGGPAARSWLQNNVRPPNDSFIKQVKQTLAETWLLEYPGSKLIVAQLMDRDIGPMGTPKTQRDYANYIARCRNTKTVRRLLREAILRFGDADSTPGDQHGLWNFVPRFQIIKPSECEGDSRRPYSHQLEAWEQLSAHNSDAETSGVFQGLLVLPTGGGKTFTAVHWLLREVLNRDFRILWIAHRHELLEQAAREFHLNAALAIALDRLRVRIVSGRHCSTTQIDPGDHVLLCSVASLARRPDVINPLLEDPKTFVVIDEAHHSPAKSYRDIIRNMGVPSRAASQTRTRQRGYRLLGLTATPTRTLEDERPLLSNLFGERVIYEARSKDLVEREILARPIPERVASHIDVEQGVTRKDESHLARFGELSPEWLNRIAELEQRNRLIVNHYLGNPKRYGKTLIFAINVNHAVLLTDAFCKQGVKAEYVASYRHDAKDNKVLIEEFRQADAGPRVLVNVEMLTEGVDVPDVQTVFLTRPTSSEILMRQMIGRALRGPEADGTKFAYLVAFEDQWSRFRDWLSPIDLVSEMVEAEDTPSVTRESKQIMDAVPWDLIRTVAARIRDVQVGAAAELFQAVPHGWYVLAREDGDAVRQTIPVYEHQFPCWNALIDELESMTPDQLARVRTARQFDGFFYATDDPVPALYEVQEVIEHMRRGGERPEYREFAERAQCDPQHLADHILKHDLPENAKASLLQDRYTSLAKAIYPTLREFRSAVDEAIADKLYPRDANRLVRAIPIFDATEKQQLAPGPQHNLRTLLKKVLSTGQSILGLPSDAPHEGLIEWTPRLIKGWYGKAYYASGDTPGHGTIRINKLLDSPDVPESVIRFLLWHEYLHLYLRQGHTPTFRKLERKWEGVVDADRFLDNLNERFGVQYW